MTLLALRTERIAVDLAPSAGGAIARFCVDGIDLLRPMAAVDKASGRGNNAAVYPLVPFSNRIANGRLVFDGGEISLLPNWPGQRHPMHGGGWAVPWSVARADARSAEIAYEHDGRSGWPFRYRARQSYRLEAQELIVALSLENLEPKAVPGGLGLHPFFVRDADSELFFHADAVWLSDNEVLPTGRVVVPDAWDFSHGRRPDDAALDNCFEDWEGSASIVWPTRRLRLQLNASDPFRHLVVYTPPGRPFFCVEPVSHANGQIGRTRLDAGATLAGEIAFRISDL
jgi:aldose 1-epimerase